MRFPSLFLVAALAVMPMAGPAHAESHHLRTPNGAFTPKAPVVRLAGIVEQVFPTPRRHHGASHQHFTVRVMRVEGARDVAPLLFVALRFGDRDGLDRPIEGLRAGQPIELQGEYIDSAHAYRAQDNEGMPPLPVLHFTHHPVGYIVYQGRRYD